MVQKSTVPSSNRVFHAGIRVITLCGSAKFEKEFHRYNKELSFAGYTVYSLIAFPSQESEGKSWYSEDQKEWLDLIHFSKIEQSDAIFVLNRDGYIGDSTRKEIRWATLRGKEIWFLEPIADETLKTILPQDPPEIT